ncbi:MAG: pilus assembly protein PilM [Desulfuromonas sp.]|nr:MAG: pilus assembly protein PilM [Desulfuromonas sp.]
MFLKGKKDLIGIDIGSSAVKLVQLKESKGVYRLQAYGIKELPTEAIVDNAIMDNTAVVDAVSELLAETKIKVKNVATSISGHSVIIRKISLPTMPEDELEKSIQYEAEQYIPFEINEVFLDFQILGTDPDDPSQMKVLLVAAKKDFVNDYLAVFREAGLNPVVVDIDGFAAQNMFEANYGLADEEIFALVNMGASAININIIKGGESVFTRDIQTGGHSVNEELQKRLGLTEEDAERAKLGASVDGVDPATLKEIIADTAANIAQEVQRSLDFFSATSADERVQKVFLAGGVSKMAEVGESLQTRLGIPVEVVDPFKGIVASSKDEEALAEVGPTLSVALGLAMRRVGDA